MEYQSNDVTISASSSCNTMPFSGCSAWSKLQLKKRDAIHMCCVKAQLHISVDEFSQQGSTTSKFIERYNLMQIRN